jgi:hypothetical protein
MQWRRRVPLVLLLLAVLAGCATDEREWMKLDSKYTVEDFRRDRAACTKDGKLNDVCMRARGWLAVNPGGKAETPKDPHANDLMPPSSRRY